MTNQPLPEEIRVEIYKEAEEMYKGILPQFRSGLINAYRTGAEKHHSLALALKDALEESQKTIEWMSNHMTVVLAKYAPIERSMVESSTIKTKAALGLFPEQVKEGKDVL